MELGTIIRAESELDQLMLRYVTLCYVRYVTFCRKYLPPGVSIFKFNDPNGKEKGVAGGKDIDKSQPKSIFSIPKIGPN